MSPSTSRLIAPAAPPAESAEVPEFALFAAAQVFLLDDVPYSAPAAIQILDGFIGRVPDSPARRRAMRIAAWIEFWTQVAYMERFLGCESEQSGATQSDEVALDPAEVERHLILTASLAVHLNDDSHIGIASGWLGVDASDRTQATFRNCLASDLTVMSAVAARSPAMYLRVAVRDRQAEADRVRAQQGGGRPVLSLDAMDVRARAEVVCVEPNPQAGLERLIETLRASDDPLNVRLAGEIEAVLDGSKKRGMGDAGYQHLRYHLPRLRDLALEMGVLPPGATARAPNRRRRKRRYTVLAPPTWFRRNRRHDSVEHRYGGADLEVYGEMSLAALPLAGAACLRKITSTASSKTRVWSPVVVEVQK